MHQYIVVGEPKDCPKLFETQRPSIGWIKRPKLAVWLNSAISYIKFQTGRSMLNYKSLLSSKQVEMMPQLDLTNRNSRSQIFRNIAITMF